MRCPSSADLSQGLAAIVDHAPGPPLPTSGQAAGQAPAEASGLQTQVEEATLHCQDEERDMVLCYNLAAHPGCTLVFA